eukprot:TRINITY_DN3066_c0_g1_i4.p1 TRINITY_DN3066_c0_g1~~TRINITY_DN3066_c0_g1_i4.p1  ORF type:complete len:733 (-),score=157.69 TRINITY_DN3066_c0_g1_i4:245-2116(-)
MEQIFLTRDYEFVPRADFMKKAIKALRFAPDISKSDWEMSLAIWCERIQVYDFTNNEKFGDAEPPHQRAFTFLLHNAFPRFEDHHTTGGGGEFPYFAVPIIDDDFVSPIDQNLSPPFLDFLQDFSNLVDCDLTGTLHSHKEALNQQEQDEEEEGLEEEAPLEEEEESRKDPCDDFFEEKDAHNQSLPIGMKECLTILEVKPMRNYCAQELVLPVHPPISNSHFFNGLEQCCGRVGRMVEVAKDLDSNQFPILMSFGDISQIFFLLFELKKKPISLPGQEDILAWCRESLEVTLSAPGCLASQWTHAMLFLCCNYKKVRQMEASGAFSQVHPKKFSFEVVLCDAVSSKLLRYGYVEGIQLSEHSIVIKAESIDDLDGKVYVLKMSSSGIRLPLQREAHNVSFSLLQQEAATLERLNACHIPHICKLVACGVSANTGQYVLVTELLGLAAVNLGRLTDDQAAKLFSDIFEALSCMKELSYVHGDVSPNNVVMCNNGEFRLIDFGSCQQAGFQSAGMQGFTREFASLQKLLKMSGKFSDDVESLAYCVYYLRNVFLPWLSEGLDQMGTEAALMRVPLLNSLVQNPPAWLRQCDDAHEVLKDSARIDVLHLGEESLVSKFRTMSKYA